MLDYRIKSALVGAFAVLVFCASFWFGWEIAGKLMTPPTRISIDLGGSLFEYLENYSNARAEKQHYMLDGLCISACTTITGEIPPEQVCVTPYAKLAFHAAFTLNPFVGRVFSPEGTELLWMIYPDWVREFLKKHGWEGPNKDQPTLIWMEAKDLLNVYKPCK